MEPVPGTSIWKNSKTGKYYKVTNKGKLVKVGNSELVGNKPLYEIIGKNTGKLSAAGLKIYKTNSNNLFVVKNGVIKKSFLGKTKIKTNPVVNTSYKIPNGHVNTGHVTTTGLKVYKNTYNRLYVVKNGIIKRTFPGKKALETPKLVPIVKPSASHIAAVNTAYVEKLKKFSEKLKELKNIEGPNNNKNFAPLAYMLRTNTMIYKYTTLKGFKATVLSSSGWKESLVNGPPKFIYETQSVTVPYTQYLLHKQLLFKYGRNINSMNNMRLSDIIDTKWMIQQDAYIRSLTLRQLFTVFGFSRSGDKWAHAYLDRTFNINRFTFHQETYFAMFFQAREFYKINTGSIEQDYEIVCRMIKAEKRMKAFETIISMFINELNDIIKKSPSVTRTFITFRGVEDDRYMSGAVDNTYTTERFCSTSVSGDVGHYFSRGHALQRITILKGSKCLMMFGLSTFQNELEILLPRGSTYRITQKRSNVTNVAGNVKPGTAEYGKRVNQLVDIVLLGTVQVKNTN